MSNWTTKIPEAARDYLAGRRLDEVECILPDIAGVARGKAMPAWKFDKQALLPADHSIFLQTITGDWASRAKGEDEYKEPDMTWCPTSAPPPPRPGPPTARCRSSTTPSTEGRPDPDGAAQRAQAGDELYAEEGWRPVVAPEMEFYLVARNTDPNHPIIPPVGRTGRRAAAKQAYSMSAVDEYGKVIDDIYDFAEAMGFEIDGILQEGGAGQVEINLRPRRPGGSGRQHLLLQADDPRGRAAPRLLRHLHGQADRGRAGLGHAHPPFGRRHRRPARTSSPGPRAARPTGLLPVHRRHAAHLPRPSR
jgi:glutamine synthetase